MRSTLLPAIVLVVIVAGLSSTGCKKEDAMPPVIPPGLQCAMFNCFPAPSTAAVAVERDVPDGGSCGSALHFSLPSGADAFSSILECGGNQVRCGTADYRVAAGGSLTLECTVSGVGPFHVNGKVTQAGGPSFEVSGDLTGDGGTVTVSAASGLDGGAAGPLSCTVAPQPILLPGAVLAHFDCTANAKPGECTFRGTFVFEGCSAAADGGS